MGVWAETIKVMKSKLFYNTLKNGNYEVEHANSANRADSATIANAVTYGYYRRRIYSGWKDNATNGEESIICDFAGSVSSDTYIVIRYAVAPYNGDWKFLETPPMKVENTRVYIPCFAKDLADGWVTVKGYIGFSLRTSGVTLLADELDGGVMAILAVYEHYTK